MNKFDDSVIQRLKINATENEIIVLSCENDVGLEEYLEKKARAIIDQKSIYSSYDENILMLEYPQANHPDSHIFDKFFESVAVVSGNVMFEGLFAIDVTSYINDLENPKFRELVNFIGKNPNTVYCIVAYTKSENVAKKLFNTLSTVGMFKTAYVSLPSKEKLTEYTTALLREVIPHISSEATEYLEAYYEDKQFGYEFADCLVNVARSCTEDSSTGVEYIKSLVKAAEEICATGTTGSSMGF